MDSLKGVDWREFLGRPALRAPAPQEVDTMLRQSILVTGAGGSIGSALALKLMQMGAARLVLLESAENSLYQLRRACEDIRPAQNGTANAANISTYVLGDAGQPGLMDEIVARHRPRIIFHAAAHKNVPLLESQPMAAIANNIFVTEGVVAAAEACAAHVVLLSTDKAVSPASLMGASKRVAEKIVLRSVGTVLRLGNVLASSGSVVEVFAEQISRGGPLTVTDPAALRYFLTMDEAVNLLLVVAHRGARGIFSPALPGMHPVADLAAFVARRLAPGREISVEFCGLRPGDKLAEQLWEDSDVARLLPDGSLVSVGCNDLSAIELRKGLEALHRAVAERDVAAALNLLRALVPEYAPSEAVLEIARGVPRVVAV